MVSCTPAWLSVLSKLLGGWSVTRLWRSTGRGSRPSTSSSSNSWLRRSRQETGRDPGICTSGRAGGLSKAAQSSKAKDCQGFPITFSVLRREAPEALDEAVWRDTSEIKSNVNQLHSSKPFAQVWSLWQDPLESFFKEMDFVELAGRHGTEHKSCSVSSKHCSS